MSFIDPPSTPAASFTTPAHPSTQSSLNTSHPPASVTEDPPPTSPAFRYPPHYSFPPFYTLQPNLTTRVSQLSSWSSLILSYCSHHRLFRLTPSHPLFTNTPLNRRLAPEDAREVLSWMAERGRVEWVDGKRKDRDGDGQDAWVWWRTAEEWAGAVARWVDDTGQKGVVLTFYELLEGDAAEGREWWGLPPEMLQKAMAVLVRRGKASVFGDGKGLGVKFY